MNPTPSAQIDLRLDAAARACLRDGVRFTELRRDILGLVLASAGPLTAYQLLDQLKETRKRAAPPTVYRALDFLLEQGLVHRVERLNAYIGCTGADRHSHPVQFLICRCCGITQELDAHDVAMAVARAASGHGFVATRTTIEIEGLCAACAVAGVIDVASA